MSTTIAPMSLREIAAQWRAFRRIYPVYAAIVRQFEIGVAPCRDLESPIDRNDPEILEAIERWFDQVDERSQAFHLRNALQRAHVATESNLRGLICRFLDKEKKSAADRDKVDFLLVQYFADRAPHSMHNRALELDDIAEVLEPVLGETVPHQPKWLDVLDGQLEALSGCRKLEDLVNSRILSDVRRLKDESGDMYFGSGAMLAFTRFNFVARHTFFRLLHADIQAMRQALHELSLRGVETVDCSAAGLSPDEPLAKLKETCHDWKTPFHAAYAVGTPFQQLIAIKNILEAEAAKAAPVPAAPVEVAPEAPPLTPESPAEVAEEAAAPVAGPPTAEITVAPVEAASEQPVQSAPKPLDLEACLEHIAEQLIGDVQSHPTAVATVFYNDSKVLLSSWEVAAFVKGGNDIADTLQRAVAARTLLLDAMDRKKKGIPAPDLEEAIKSSHAELAMMQERIAQAKEAKNIDAAVNLAATCKRLMSLIDEAEKLRS